MFSSLWHILRLNGSTFPIRSIRLDACLLGGQSFVWFKRPFVEGEPVEYVGVIDEHVIGMCQTDQNLYFRLYKPNTDSEMDWNWNSDEMNNLLIQYLRLDVQIEELYEIWKKNDKLFRETTDAPTSRFNGIRMLRQQPWQTILCFICSSNNNIIRITSMIQSLCRLYGSYLGPLDDRQIYSFPKCSQMVPHLATMEETLRQHGFGYRARFVTETVDIIVKSVQGREMDLDQNVYDYFHSLCLPNASLETARIALERLSGIGRKVADCICLMSLEHLNAVPVDTHVRSIVQRHYHSLLKQQLAYENEILTTEEMPRKRQKKDSLISLPKTLTPRVHNAIQRVFQDLFGEKCGWAHTVLFVSDLRQFQ